MLLSRLWAQRLVRFGTVAVFCTTLQDLVLLLLVDHGWDKLVANGASFLLSAQVNFALSSALTWGDRRLDGSLRLVWAVGWRWFKFNSAAVIALLVNEAVVFLLAVHFGVWVLPASLAGVLVGTTLAFVVNHFITFRPGKDRCASVDELSSDGDQEWSAIWPLVQEEGVAFFLPAWNEAHNLGFVVPQLVEFFEAQEVPCSIIIVNDGSTDETGDVAEQLAETYPDVVLVEHHADNQGYGAGLKTGSLASLKTPHGLVAFFDADGQFDIADLPRLIGAMLEDDADFAVGHRVKRADPLLRRLTGGGWQLVCRLMLQVRASDTDCGFKLFRRPMLAAIAEELRFRRGAAVNPEIFARAAHAGFRFVEVGVSHFPRRFGEQSGIKLKVIVASFIDLVRLRLELWRKALSAPQEYAASVSASE